MGKRLVDVGFPMWLIGEGAKQQKRVMCELKKGYTNAELWKLCWKYFTAMRSHAATHPDDIVCFVASSPFLDSTPEQRPVESGLSAHDSRKKCLKLIEANSQFIVMDDVVAHSRFPLAQIFEGTAEPVLEPLVSAVSKMYLGTPPKPT